MTDLITKVKAALEGATPGPWGSHCNDDSFSFDVRQWTDPASRGPYQNGELICSTSPSWIGSYAHGHQAWQRSSTPPFCPSYFDARLIALAPDMALALIAAGELADVCDELMGLFPDQRLHLDNALAAFRAAMEGRTDDRP